MSEKIIVLDSLEDVESEPCLVCGSTHWIPDTDGEGNWWLLCMGMNCGCVETKELPPNTKVIM